ncbi:MAG: glycosyltransferase family 2 protein [Desulfobacteraceae bacterium]|nr:glycosyltransferase family 2 protein [Desulfobacteraceae bacterium]MBC2756766.1 glycosyltransferase family 2 protein [Desulfobacteraceae bacterium]
MKLIVQIPCYNEEKTLPQTVRDIPREIEGIDTVEILVIDDGSSDLTIKVAQELGVDHIVRNKGNKGLAFSFITGIEASLRLGADIIVNTDGDNQYKGSYIPKLITPILSGEADIVVGDRKTDAIEHFSFIKKQFQKLGSRVVRMLSNTDVPDAVSGFRAFSRDAAMQLNIVSEYSYTVETIIQAGKKQLCVKSLQIGTNPKTRESRLMKSVPRFVLNQLNTMVRMYTMFKPLRVFFFIGCLCIILGLIPSVRYLYFFLEGDSAGHIQSLIFAAIMFIVGFQVIILGLLGDVISFNRKLIEETLLRVRRIELDFLNENDEK